MVWYDSTFSKIIGVGIVVSSLSYIFAIHGPVSPSEIELEKIKAGYVIKTQDLNGNGQPERFIERDGTRFFLEIDGENLDDRIIRETTK